MFAHIRRHQKWLWILVSVLTIVSFVWFFNPNQQYGVDGGGPGGVVGTLYGEPIKLAQYQDAYREAMLQHLFNYGEWPDSRGSSQFGQSLEQETRSRLFLIRKLKDLNIQVDESAVAEWIVTAFQDRETKQFNKDVYPRFIQQIEQRRLKEVDFQRYVRHQVGIQHLAAVAGSSGKLVTPQEAEQAFREENQKVDTKVARFSLTNYQAAVQATPEALAGFYTNRSSGYRLPERLQLSYVPFWSSNFLAKAEQTVAGLTNLSQQIDSIYLQRGPQFYADLNGQPMTADAAKAKIREEMLQEAAILEARRAAFAFATELEKIPVKPSNTNPAETLENLAAAKGLASQVTEPFTQFEGPQGLNLPEQFTRTAFMLTAEEPIVAEPVVGDSGVHVMSFKRKIPSELQPLEAIRDKVTQDYQRSETQRLAREAGSAFVNALTNGLAAGKTFDEIAQQAGVAAVDVAPFSKNSQDSIVNLPAQINPSSIRAVAFNLAEGKASSYLSSADGGYVVYVEKFIPATDEEVKAGLAGFTDTLRRRSAAQAFNNWFAKEMELAKLTLPGDEAGGQAAQ